MRSLSLNTFSSLPNTFRIVIVNVYIQQKMEYKGQPLHEPMNTEDLKNHKCKSSEQWEIVGKRKRGNEP